MGKSVSASAATLQAEAETFTITAEPGSARREAHEERQRRAERRGLVGEPSVPPRENERAPAAAPGALLCVRFVEATARRL